MAQNLWTYEQLIEVLKLYCQTPFGQLHSRNPTIIALAAKIGRTASAVALKSVNFASLDPTIHQKGMGNASKLDRKVWNDFFENTDRFIDVEEIAGETPQGMAELSQAEYIANLPVGADVNVLAKARRNQGFFRDMIFASYNSRCAISQISMPELLIASHIVPWAMNPSLRTNPQNGICLNALHDKAFDRGLISFSDDYSVMYSSALPRDARLKLGGMGGDQLILPEKFHPSLDFLKFHREQIFKG